MKWLSTTKHLLPFCNLSNGGSNGVGTHSPSSLENFPDCAPKECGSAIKSTSTARKCLRWKNCGNGFFLMGPPFHLRDFRLEMIISAGLNKPIPTVHGMQLKSKPHLIRERRKSSFSLWYNANAIRRWRLNQTQGQFASPNLC